MDTLVLVVVGLIVGFGASRIVSWRRANSLPWSMLTGILGAFGGAMLGRALGYSTRDAVTFWIAILGAVAVVAMYLGMTSRRIA